MLIKALIAALSLSAVGSLSAQTSVWQPAPGHAQVPIWPGAPPGPRTTGDSETAGGHLVAAVSAHFEQRVYPAVDAAD